MNVLPSRHPKYRSKLCRNFVTGDCPFGQKCSFLHPASRNNPPSLLAQYLSNWNALLPQPLALPNWQGTQMNMTRPPSSQAPRLVDEDPSPSTSLLLSTSDCTSPDQVPKTRRFGRRKKYPCRHFIRTGGWCPAGAQCRFYHDVAALPAAGILEAKHSPPFESNVYEEGRIISGGIQMGVQLPSIVNHGYSEPSKADLVQPYQPMYWPDHSWQPCRPYYATAPATIVAPIPATVAPSSVMQYSVYPPPQLQAQIAPLGETQTNLPSGAYEVNGTTYFPVSMPPIPAPPPVIYSIPVHPVPYNNPTVPSYPYCAPPTLPATYCGVPNGTSDVRPQTSFDPFGSDSTRTSQLPVTPRLENYQMSSIQHDAISLPLLPSSTLTDDLALTTTKDKPRATKDSAHDFPYRAPKNQRIGHTGRISVNIKKQGRVNSG